MRNAGFLLAALLLFAAAACSERERDGPTATSPGSSAPAELESIASAVEKAGSYRLQVEQENLVLPRWGGSDGGTVLVDLRSGVAYAKLFRTGDGAYEIVLRDGETYFKRETCGTWARIADGADVLATFVLTPGEIRRSTALGGGEFEVEGVGKVVAEFDSQGRLAAIRSDTMTNNGQPLTWRFEAWGEEVRAPKPETSRLSGPGGNPC